MIQHKREEDIQLRMEEEGIKVKLSSYGLSFKGGPALDCMYQ